jgi:hypothetical protein
MNVDRLATRPPAEAAPRALPLARAIPWKSEEVLSGITRAQLTLPLEREAYRPILWNDLCSEFDAELMWDHLQTLELSFSAEFHQVIGLWRRDEANHCRGFLRLYELVYGDAQDVLLERLRQRTPDFAPLEPFFADEVSVCALFAFDEIATSRSYADDFAFYDKFGVPALGQWIRKVSRDEGIHFGNFVRLIQRQPGARDIAAITAAILEHDRNQHQYAATFVLDHTGPQFNAAFLEGCAESLIAAVNAFALPEKLS